MLKKKELLLIAYLRKNARETMTNLSKSTKMPISTIFDKIRGYDQKGVISKHTALIDFSTLGFNARVNIMLGVDKKSREELKNHLKKDQRINNLYRVNNGFDFVLEGIFKDLKELQEFIENMEENFDINRREVFYIIDDVKREAFLSNPKNSFFT